jgi:rhodanese-related sulfurtransferase
MAKTAAELVQEARAQIQNVSPRDARDEIASGKAVVLDVREPMEWEQHIEGSVQVPRGLLEFAADPTSPQHKPELDPSRRVIVYCRSGVRGTLAAYTLKIMGYENVANIEGGFTAWTNAGLPIVSAGAKIPK